MGPKKEVKEAELESTRSGARFADVLVGQRSNPIKITVNLNCNVEILLDAAKKEVHKRLEEKIQLLKAAIINENAATALSGTQATQDGDAAAHPNEAIIQKLSEFQAAIKSDNGRIDLIKEGVATGCNQKLNAIAVNDVLVHNTTYTMGTVNTENTPPISLFMIEDKSDRPASGAVKKK
jgi:hypothetical protein